MLGTFDLALKLRGWQVFTAIVAVAWLGLVAVWVMMPSPIGPDGTLAGPTPASWSAAWVAGMVMGALQTVVFGWLVAVGGAMNSRLPEHLRLSPTFAVTGLVASIGYASYAGYQFTAMMFPMGEGRIGAGMMLMHIGCFAFNFYALWYASRNLVAAESGTNDDPEWPRIIITGVSVWLTLAVPLGAWWVQERARAVAAR